MSIVLIQQYIAELDPDDQICPSCGAEHPSWKKHGVYLRNLIMFEDGHAAAHLITITRFRCSSCGHTHAILPSFLIPFQSYSFLFIISVMYDYFHKTITIDQICTKYGISASTLYTWKALFLQHKKIWLGLLEDAYTSSLEFINSFTSGSFWQGLKEFLNIAGQSFLQGASCFRKANSHPVGLRSP